ncbi:unnamed protein product [Parascedosporium putredinis]|uniref:Translation initiation factor IF-2, mitochondrial n=1 Tax=Parascedosporium putredinis TaxID=1442378 RepID=A0A9P1H271_9PEZI|nr:unnamed protein product [Parascedosporium putredinis]CAI7994675.1 unnamed protein product [Parascedosporium putredinis]
MGPRAPSPLRGGVPRRLCPPSSETVADRIRRAVQPRASGASGPAQSSPGPTPKAQAPKPSAPSPNPQANARQHSSRQAQNAPGQHAAQNRTPHKPNWGGPAARSGGADKQAGGDANKTQQSASASSGPEAPADGDAPCERVARFWDHFGEKRPAGKAGTAAGAQGEQQDNANWSRLPRRARNPAGQASARAEDRGATDAFLAQLGGTGGDAWGQPRQSGARQPRGAPDNNNNNKKKAARAKAPEPTCGQHRKPILQIRGENLANQTLASNENLDGVRTPRLGRGVLSMLRPATPDRHQARVINPSPRPQSHPHPARPRASQKAKARSRGGRRFDDADDGYDEDIEILAEQRRRQKMEEKAARKARRAAGLENDAKAQIFLPEYIGVTALASALKVTVPNFMKALEQLGFEEVTEDSVFTGETAGLVAQEFGFEVTVDDGAARDIKPQPVPEDWSAIPQRPPVVAIMGHVDHGKTTLLDWLRKSSIAAQEHGGITQHIGAFAVNLSSGKSITFLDTPGHAAFLSMRQRGAEVTDIVILVVAADDSVKPQTLEALKHVRDAKVPMIVAITKVDKEDARITQVKSDLSNHGVELEEYGGDVQAVCVSGKTGQGMDDLEENILTLSEILDVRGDPETLAEGWVLEASVKPVGKAATVLIKSGTLRVGDCLVCGTAWAKVRVLRNEAGQEIDEAPPGTAVEILGWRDELPKAGDRALQPADEARARQAIDYRREMQGRQKSSDQIAEAERLRREAEAKAELESAAGEEGEIEAEPAMITVNFIVRGDVVGSVEAVCATIQEIGNNEIRPKILRSAAGAITESDVEYAGMSGSVIVNFNNTIPGHIKNQAEEAGVKILDRSVIYHLGDDIKTELSARLPEAVSQRVLGEAEIQQVFPINIKGRVYKNIAGCKIRNGVIRKADMVRIFRKGKKVFDGKLESLKHGKKDVTEMRKGSECGMGCIDFQDLQAGDQIQAYEEVREKRTL